MSTILSRPQCDTVPLTFTVLFLVEHKVLLAFFAVALLSTFSAVGILAFHNTLVPIRHKSFITLDAFAIGVAVAAVFDVTFRFTYLLLVELEFVLAFNALALVVAFLAVRLIAVVLALSLLVLAEASITSHAFFTCLITFRTVLNLAVCNITICTIISFFCRQFFYGTRQAQ